MIKYKKGQIWNKSKNKIMLRFEKETGKNAIYNNKITGQFEYWLWQHEKNLQKQLDVHWKATEKERILTHSGKIGEKHKKEIAATAVKQARIKEIEKDYQNLKKTSKAELWIIYSRIHKVISEDKQASKASIISGILNDEYRRSDLDAWYKATTKPKKRTPKKKTTKPKTTKVEAFKKRKIILEQLYETLFLTTKDFADILGISTNEAYKHAKWLEDHNLVAGQASAGTGVSTPRGTYKILSILWEPYYHRESYPDIEFKEVVKMLKKEMKM